MTIQYNNLFHWYLAGGLCVIPVHSDGTKRPALPTWKMFQGRFPTEAEVDLWRTIHASLAIVCGLVSGGLEVLDFDQPGLFEQFWPLGCSF